MYQFEIRDGIEDRVSSQTVRHLHSLWERHHAARGDLPAYGDLSPQRLDWCAPNLMVVEPLDDGDFLYRYYGKAIADAARFDLTGKRIGEFRSDVGRFFCEKYRRCLQLRRPLYTVHRATHVSTVHTWERLLLPVIGDSGVLVVALNQPIEMRHEFLQGVIDSIGHGILFAGALHRDGNAGGAVTDFQLMCANDAAARLLARPAGALGETSLLSALPDALGEPLLGLCRTVCETGRSTSIQVRVRGLDEGIDRVVEVSGVRSGVGVTMVLTEASRQPQHEATLQELEQRLASERQARSRLDSQLRALNAATAVAGPPRRDDLLAGLGLELEKAAANGNSLSLLALGLDGPGEPRSPVVANEDTLTAVWHLCQGMLRRSDWVCRLAPGSLAAVLPGVTEETARATGNRIAQAVSLRFYDEPMLSARISLSVGYAGCVPGDDAERLVARAEEALDIARAPGRGGRQQGLS